MKAVDRLKGFLVAENEMLKNFSRRARAGQSFDPELLDLLSRLEALNAKEITRWESDLSGCGDQPVTDPESDR